MQSLTSFLSGASQLLQPLRAQLNELAADFVDGFRNADRLIVDDHRNCSVLHGLVQVWLGGLPDRDAWFHGRLSALLASGDAPWHGLEFPWLAHSAYADEPMDWSLLWHWLLAPFAAPLEEAPPLLEVRDQKTPRVVIGRLGQGPPEHGTGGDLGSLLDLLVGGLADLLVDLHLDVLAHLDLLAEVAAHEIAPVDQRHVGVRALVLVVLVVAVKLLPADVRVVGEGGVQ